MNRVSAGVLATLVVILIGSGLLAYISRDRLPKPAASTAEATATPEDHNSKNPMLWELFGGTTGLTPSSYSGWEATASRIMLRFSLAAFLAGVLAFRPRRGTYSRRNPYVAQTQILMAVAVGAMM